MCGSRGHVHEHDLTDDLFGVPGRFALDRCDAPSCGLVWLEDMPDEDGCGAFYQSYYTHAEAPLDAPRSGPLKRLVDALWPIGAQRARRREMYSFFLPDAGGTVMEAGCGAGKNLAKLRARGWTVVGQDIDPNAAATARSTHDIEVKVGTIASVDIEPGSLDAVLMHHVVEHLREPARDLEACRAHLRVGGRLVVITPNSVALGASVFGRRWRGLEPPRHLFLYNVPTLRRRLTDAGFTDVQVFTRGARTEMIAFDTVEAMLPRAHRLVRYGAAKSVGMVLQVLASILMVDRRGRGEELVAIATRSAD